MGSTTPSPSSWRSWPPAAKLKLLTRLQAELAGQTTASNWRRIARPNQLPPPGDWRIWAFVAGRGSGKTRAGAEWTLEQVRQGARRIALVGPTAADARDVMVEGESGILSISQGADRPLYEPSKRRLTWPNGAIATTFSADKPDRLRGPQHDAAWIDEVASWRFGQQAFDMLLLGLRIGKDPRCVATTTPKATRFFRELLTRKMVVVTRGNTFENRANLAPAFFEQITAQYEGTRIGRQELYAELLDDAQGALWKREWLENGRVVQHPDLLRVLVAVDPEATSGENSAETGILVTGRGADGHGYVLEDNSLRGTPGQWARAAVAAYYRHAADAIVAEINQGGEMVEHTIRTVDPGVRIILVHASRGKQARADPVAALYEQGRMHHVGYFAELEDQLTNWVPGAGNSPDRLDALVWGVTELDMTTAAVSTGALAIANDVQPTGRDRLQGSRWNRTARNPWRNRR